MENEIDYKKMCELILKDYNSEREEYYYYRNRGIGRCSYGPGPGIPLVTLDNYHQKYIKECTDYKSFLAEIENVYKTSIENLKNRFGVK